jgi:hypothetical protein
MHFIIQTIDGQIKHDFSFTLLEAIRYQNWYRNEQVCRFSLIDSGFPDFRIPGIPVGSVEFVSNYLEKYYNLKPAPRNVPDQLITYAGRLIFDGSHLTTRYQKCFAKSNDTIKGFSDFVDPGDVLPAGNYQFSSEIEMDSEWRCFVYQNDLVGLQNYSGDFTLFPDVSKIKEMIRDFSGAPVAYTLDVCVNGQGTFVVEVHDFFSCGLYGFADLRILPHMFARWFDEFIKEGTIEHNNL